MPANGNRALVCRQDGQAPVVGSGGLISGRSGARPIGPALLDRHPMHQFWPDGLSLLNQSGIDA